MENYFLLEVGVEELPSRFVESTLTQIKENLEKSLKENRVEFKDIEKYGTPRRLTFVINNICDKQSDLEEELNVNSSFIIPLDVVDASSSKSVVINLYDTFLPFPPCIYPPVGEVVYL